MAKEQKTRQDGDLTRIQREKREVILEAALDVFSVYGFRGSTVDQVAAAAGMSKPNLLYYFPTKEAMHHELIERLLHNWLEPLAQMRADGDPIAEISNYLHRKLELSRTFPRESRIFANEILQGAPRITDLIEGELKELVEEKAKLIRIWIDQGKIAPIDPYHLLFSIWATTQHYADFDVQVKAILSEDKDSESHFGPAWDFLSTMYTKLLTPEGK